LSDNQSWYDYKNEQEAERYPSKQARLNEALANIGKYDELMQRADTPRQRATYKGLLRRWQGTFEAIRDE